jgi:hypothetical protein
MLNLFFNFLNFYFWRKINLNLNPILSISMSLKLQVLKYFLSLKLVTKEIEYLEG